MKIALCFSGQLRTWRKTMPQFKKFMGILEDKGHSVDVFCHMWNFNTYSNTYSNSVDHKFEDSLPYEIVEQSEINELLAELTPKSFLIQKESVSLRAKQTILYVTNKFIRDVYGLNDYGHYFAPQFYSIMRSAHLKRKYESDNDFIYDACFRIRYDLLISDEQIKYFFEIATEFKKPQIDTIYSVHNGRDPQFPFFRTGDIFWFSNSDTFDRTCDFYRWLRLYGKRALRPDCPREVVFFYYLKFINLNIHMLHTDPIIARLDNYPELSQESGHME
jgi:hypothetical protein